MHIMIKYCDYNQVDNLLTKTNGHLNTLSVFTLQCCKVLGEIYFV